MHRFLYGLAKLTPVAFIPMLLLLTSCATEGQTAANDTGLDGKSITLVTRATPDFGLVSSSGVAAGAFAVFVPGQGEVPDMSTPGNRAVVEDHIDDPAHTIGPALLTDLVGAHHLAVSKSGSSVVAKGDKPLTSKELPTDVDLVLDVGTVQWRTYYFLNLTQYDVFYYGRVRLLNAKTGEALRKATCSRKPIKTSDSPDWDGLLADHGVRMRADMQAAGEACLQDLRRELGISAH